MFRRRFMLHLISAIAMVALNTAIQAQPTGRTGGAEPGQRPLNLSLPRDAIFPDRTMQLSDTDRLLGNLHAPVSATGEGGSRRFGEGTVSGSPPRQPAGQPYGTGFEARQRSMAGSGRAPRGR